MNIRLDLYLIGLLIAAVGASELLPFLLAVVFREPATPYLVSAIITTGVGYGIAQSSRHDDWRVRPRDGFLVVTGGWFLVSLFGAFPYIATGTLAPVDALFESVSGFTTTGSTVMTDIEAAPRAMLFWRSFTQWVGGMGIILFTIAILPLLGIGGMQLFKAEVPGPVADKLRPRLAETARRLWLVYVGFTVAECYALMLAGIEPYEALCHSLTTLATGGFSTRNTSIAAFQSPLVEWIIIVFMMAAGINFVLHYRVLSGRLRPALRDSELRYFLAVVALSSAGLALMLIGAGTSGGEEAVRHAVFTTVAMITTTGYGTADFEQWLPLAHVILLAIMTLGGMAGSTSGGIKSLRALLGLRALSLAFQRLIHPRGVNPLKYGGHAVPEDVMQGIWGFFTAYTLIVAFATAAVAAAGYDLVTAISTALTAVGNVGPGLGEVGPFDNFAHFPDSIKIVLSFCMLAGRLEIFTVMVMISPEFWRR